MLVVKTENRRWWDYEIDFAPRFVEVLRGIAAWLGRIGAILGGLVLPGLFIAALVDLQLSTEPDLPGGFEGLEGCLALVIGAPAGFIGLALGVASLPSSLHRRFVLVVAVIEVVLAVLAFADLMQLELIR